MESSITGTWPATRCWRRPLVRNRRSKWAIPEKCSLDRYFVNPPGASPHPLYDVTADGQRFLMLKDDEGMGENGPASRLIVVQHFDEELKHLVPTK